MDGVHVAARGDSNARPVHRGDVWFVPPGLPHAIGAGVFLVEIQEPTDFSIVLEVAGFPVDPDDASLRLGWDVAIDAVDRRGHRDAAIDALRQPPTPFVDGADRARASLLGPAGVPFFRAERLSVRAPTAPRWNDAFVVGIVTAGSGTVRATGREIRVRAGSTFAVPAAAVADLELAPDAAERPLALIACLPPPPDRLERRIR